MFVCQPSTMQAAVARVLLSPPPANIYFRLPDPFSSRRITILRPFTTLCMPKRNPSLLLPLEDGLARRRFRCPAVPLLLLNCAASPGMSSAHDAFRVPMRGIHDRNIIAHAKLTLVLLEAYSPSDSLLGCIYRLLSTIVLIVDGIDRSILRPTRTLRITYCRTDRSRQAIQHSHFLHPSPPPRVISRASY